MGNARVFSLTLSPGNAFLTLRHSMSNCPRVHQPLCWLVGTLREKAGWTISGLAIALAKPLPACLLIDQHSCGEDQVPRALVFAKSIVGALSRLLSSRSADVGLVARSRAFGERFSTVSSDFGWGSKGST